MRSSRHAKVKSRGVISLWVCDMSGGTIPGVIANGPALLSPASLPGSTLPLLLGADGVMSAAASESAFRSLIGLAGLSTDANGVASLNGTAAEYRAYGPTGVPYVTMRHDGTNGILQPSAGDMILRSPTGGTNLGISGTNYTGMKGGVASGYVGFWSVSDDNFTTVRGQYKADAGLQIPSNLMVRFSSTASATGTADGAIERVGSNILGVCTGTAGNRAALYTGTHRVYDQAANTNYLALSHDGTLGNINNPTGDVVLSASNVDIARVRSASAAGITLPSHAFLAFSSTTSPNGSFDTVIGRYGAGIALAGTALGALRYGWDGTNAVLAASSGNVGVYRGSTLCAQTNNANGLNVYNRLQLMDGGSTLYGFFDAGATNPFKFGSGVMLGWANTAAASGAVDAALARRSGGGGIESNNGTAGTLRDIYFRSGFGIAQSSTDVALCAQAHASQGSTSPILKVITSAGGDLFRVLPDRTVVGPDMILDLPASTDGASATGRNGIRTGYGAMYLKSGNTDNLVVSANLLQVGGGGASTVIQCADRGSSLTLNVIDHYGNTNLAGKDLIYQAGRGTGTADGGAHRFKVAPSPGVSGTTFGTLVDALVLESRKVAFIANAATAPAVAPAGGVYLWSEGGVLKAMGASGVATTLAS